MRYAYIKYLFEISILVIYIYGELIKQSKSK
jgi:hypothetical protein